MGRQAPHKGVRPTTHQHLTYLLRYEAEPLWKQIHQLATTPTDGTGNVSPVDVAYGTTSMHHTTLNTPHLRQPSKTPHF